MIWVFDIDQKAWLLGGGRLGCGVFIDRNGKWTANVVCGDNINCLGDFDTQAEAKAAAEKEYERLRERI